MRVLFCLGGENTGIDLAAAVAIVRGGHVCDRAPRWGGRSPRHCASAIANGSQARHDAVKVYDDRLMGLRKLQGQIAAEHRRLQNFLG